MSLSPAVATLEGACSFTADVGYRARTP